MSLSSSLSASASTSPLLSSSTASPSMMNRQWILKRRPVGIFDPKLDVELITTNEDNEDDLKDNEIVVRPELLSVDAFLRTMCDENAPYHGRIELAGGKGDTGKGKEGTNASTKSKPFPAIGFGTVIKAGAKSGHTVGKRVTGMLGAADTVTVDGAQVFRAMKFPLLPLSASLGLMGLTAGLTAYCGVFYVASKRPSKGETVVVTGAAGSVGSIAVQLLKYCGARVIGVAGGTKKAQYLMEELKCDGVIDYKDTKNRKLHEQIEALCPDGIDFIYDNVGGTILDALLYRINPKGRVVICGAISQYSGKLNTENKETGGQSKVEGPSNYLKLAERGAEMKGFNVMQYMMKLPLMVIGMYYLYLRGYVTVQEHIEDGLGTEYVPYVMLPSVFSSLSLPFLIISHRFFFFTFPFFSSFFLFAFL